MHTQKALDNSYKYSMQSYDLVKDHLTKEALQDVTKQALDIGVKYAKEHPYLLTAQVAGVAVSLAPAIVTSPVLGAIGIGAQGPVAGSLASGYQATLGGYIPAGSAFSVCQRIAMTGKAPVISGLACAGEVVAGAYQIFRRQSQAAEGTLKET
ncbi:MAG: hypothetical protein M1836_001909 [Candelina mexicana]|nr:MAG: hypothetical protein M1836_001909 [Candelina mexicana]